MKLSKSELFKTAWNNARYCSQVLGGKAFEYFSNCLKNLYKILKNSFITKRRVVIRFMKNHSKSFCEIVLNEDITKNKAHFFTRFVGSTKKEQYFSFKTVTNAIKHFKMLGFTNTVKNISYY